MWVNAGSDLVLSRDGGREECEGVISIWREGAEGAFNEVNGVATSPIGAEEGRGRGTVVGKIVQSGDIDAKSGVNEILDGFGFPCAFSSEMTKPSPDNAGPANGEDLSGRRKLAL